MAQNDSSDSPTLSLGVTMAGTIIGTAAYMAPEQAQGKQVDKRADIWAFAVLLYELLTGRCPFQAEDAPEILVQLLTNTPDFEPAPFKARRLLEERLQKDPKQRLRDIGDARRLVTNDVPATPGRTLRGGSPLVDFGFRHVGGGTCAVVLDPAAGVVAAGDLVRFTFRAPFWLRA